MSEEDYSQDFKDGDWICTFCGDHQFARNTVCRSCQNRRAPESLLAASSFDSNQAHSASHDTGFMSNGGGKGVAGIGKGQPGMGKGVPGFGKGVGLGKGKTGSKGDWGTAKGVPGFAKGAMTIGKGSMAIGKSFMGFEKGAPLGKGIVGKGAAKGTIRAAPRMTAAQAAAAWEMENWQPPVPPAASSSAFQAASNGTRKSPVEFRLSQGEKLYHGRIRQFNHARNRGYIMSAQAMLESGQEVYVWQDTLLQANAGVGDYVLFFLHWSVRGQPQASPPMLKLSGGSRTMSHKGLFSLAKDESKGFGFINCPEIKEYFGRDVFVNKDLAAGLLSGTTVCFNCFLNKDGFPTAEAVIPCDPDWAPIPPDLSLSQEVVDVEDPNSDLQPMGSSAAESASSITTTGETFTGLVKSFNPNGHYGFVECKEVEEQYKQNVFIHQNNLAEPVQAGDTVEFELAISRKGQPQGQNVRKVVGTEQASTEQVHEAVPVAPQTGLLLLQPSKRQKLE